MTADNLTTPLPTLPKRQVGDFLTGAEDGEGGKALRLLSPAVLSVVGQARQLTFGCPADPVLGRPKWRLDDKGRIRLEALTDAAGGACHPQGPDTEPVDLLALLARRRRGGPVETYRLWRFRDNGNALGLNDDEALLFAHASDLPQPRGLAACTLRRLLLEAMNLR